MSEERDGREKRENPDNLNKPGESRMDRRDRGKETPGYSNQTGDLDRVKNMDSDVTDAGLDALDSDVDQERIKGDDLDHVKGNIPGRSDLDAGEIERGPESGRGSRGKGSEGGEISGI